MFKNIDKKNLARRFIWVMIGVIFMGFGISWLIPCGFGTDGYTAFNYAVSDKIGLSFGTWQAAFNCVLFVIVIICDRRNIGLGTIANMLVVGYSCDFFSMIWNRILPSAFFANIWLRAVVAVPALIIFVIAAAIYMDMGLGTSPYDALPFIIHKRTKKLSFRFVRITYDLIFIVIGYAFGAPFAVITLIMAFLLGPTVEMVGEKIKPLLENN